MNQENIKFKLEFESRYWDQPPGITVLVGQQQCYHGLAWCQQLVVEFYCVLDFDQDYTLMIKRWNKTDDQCQTVDNNTKDQMLILRKVEIDHIDVQNVVLSASWFEPQYSVTYQPDHALETQVLGETWFGHNGTWRLQFRSPTWQWLIKDIWGG